MLYRQINTVCYEMHTKHWYKPCGQKADFFLVWYIQEPLGFKGLKRVFKFRVRYLTYSQYLKCRENNRSKWFVGELIFFYLWEKVTKKTFSMYDIQLEWTVCFVMQPNFHTLQRNCIHEQYDGQNSISEQKLTLLKKMKVYSLDTLESWKFKCDNISILFTKFLPALFIHIPSSLP